MCPDEQTTCISFQEIPAVWSASDLKGHCCEHFYRHAKANNLAINLSEKCKEFDGNDLEFESLRASQAGPLAHS